MLKQIGGAPFDGGRKELPGGVGTSDPVQRVSLNSIVGRTDALPTKVSELPTPTKKAGLSAQVCAKCLSKNMLAFQGRFGIFHSIFRIPLNSTMFSILKFKIKIYKRFSIKLKYHLFSKLGELPARCCGI
jgi:hypothetical protein